MEVLVDFEGFGFTMGGIAHFISEVEVEELFTPPVMPEGYQGDPSEEFLGRKEGL